MLHAEIKEGSIFSGKHVTLWDLSEEQLKVKLLDARGAGTEVWLEGQPFNWQSAVLQVYEGPSTADIPDFTRVLGPGAYAVTGVMQEVTDRYVTGPPGGSADLVASHERSAPQGSSIFVVHGSNVAAREETARFLEQITDGAHSIVILHEQDNRGQTVVEKLERAGSEARYAVILLTADDEGRRRGDEQLRMRARQNVVLELGYFYALLGRANVAVLYETGVEIPSDISGVLYIQLDETGGWKLKLVKELRGAGLDATLDRL